MDDVDNFLKVAEMVGRIVGLTNEHKSVESVLQCLVRIVRAHPEKRDWFESKFIEMFENEREYSGLIISYCMHVFKFQKVLTHVQKRVDRDLDRTRRRFGIADPEAKILGTDDHARHVLEAFSPDWSGRKIFAFPESE
jgi:hypothetical protein